MDLMGVGENMNYQNTFAAEIAKDGTIYNTRTGVPVGVDNQRVRDMEAEHANEIAEAAEVADRLYQELVDAGLRVVKKTPEEIARDAAEQQLTLAREQARQQAEINESLLGAIKGLQAEISGLKATKDELDKHPVGKRKKPPTKPEAGAAND